MTLQFHPGQRELQDRFDTRRLADKLGDVAGTTFSAELAAFVAARDMFFLATSGPDGQPDCSYKGGHPGFVRVISDDTLAFPSYDGKADTDGVTEYSTGFTLPLLREWLAEPTGKML